MTTYITLIRGINVGGNNIVPMQALREHLAHHGFLNVQTYIQSGNVLFQHPSADREEIIQIMAVVFHTYFSITPAIAILTKDEWLNLVIQAPTWWGVDSEWKHNLIVLTQRDRIQELRDAFAHLRPEIEKVSFGEYAVFQSLLQEKFGQTSSSKLVQLPIYSSLTIRNANTMKKITELLQNYS
jgi:uncharacterized protein (DUF1697 family)